MSSLYAFSETAAKNAKPLNINQAIRDILAHDNDACYAEMEQFLMPPGVAGSRAFDQALAVEVLLKHDSDGNGTLAKMIVAQPQLSRRVLWDRLQNVLRQAGFQMRHGRLIGLLESDSHDDEPGQPDID